VDPGADTDPSTLTLTFSLVASAHLALARGDGRRAATALGAAEGLRRRAGLRGPAARRGEAELIGRVTREIGAEAYADAVAEGAGFGSREAVGLIRRP
jgi:hypothetical protein